MTTKVELDREGNKVTTWHATSGNLASYTHPYDQKALCEACNPTGTTFLWPLLTAKGLPRKERVRVPKRAPETLRNA